MKTANRKILQKKTRTATHINKCKCSSLWIDVEYDNNFIGYNFIIYVLQLHDIWNENFTFSLKFCSSIGLTEQKYEQESFSEQTLSGVPLNLATWSLKSLLQYYSVGTNDPEFYFRPQMGLRKMQTIRYLEDCVRDSCKDSYFKAHFLLY